MINNVRKCCYVLCLSAWLRARPLQPNAECLSPNRKPKPATTSLKLQEIQAATSTGNFDLLSQLLNNNNKLNYVY